MRGGGGRSWGGSDWFASARSAREGPFFGRPLPPFFVFSFLWGGRNQCPNFLGKQIHHPLSRTHVKTNKFGVKQTRIPLSVSSSEGTLVVVILKANPTCSVG